MSSIDIKTAKAAYKGATEDEMLHNMAKAYGCRRMCRDGEKVECACHND